MAYTPAQREEKRQLIVTEAGKLLLKKTYPDISISEIARQSGMAKGTLYNFFDNKEELFIELYKFEVNEWLNDLVEIFGQRKSKAEILDDVVDRHWDRHLFVRLMTILNTILEQKLDEEYLKGFKYFLLDIVGGVAGKIEENSEFINAGEFGPFIVRYTAFFNGIYHLGLQSRQLEKLFRENPQLAIFSPDTKEEAKLYVKQYFQLPARMH